MPAWLAAIPVIGGLIDSIGNAIDKNVTSDQERLKLKAEMTSMYVPVLTAVIQAQATMNELQVKMAEIEAKSEHWLVWSRRPIIAFAAIFNFILANVLAAFGYAYMDPTEAMYFAMLVNGLDTGSRGIEKLAQTWRNPESIHR